MENGIAVHNGSLPRQVLCDIESLVKSKAVKMVIASPSVAQGIDFPCSALIFQSLYRNRELIPASEFTNVIGRVGRAFVDIDGLSICPIYEKEPRKAQYKIKSFSNLWASPQNKELESSIYQLIAKLFGRLSEEIGISPGELAESVVNIDFNWENYKGHLSESNEKEPEISSLVAQLDEMLITLLNPSANIENLATMLDELMQNSYWKIRLARHANTSIFEYQKALMLGRAKWIWSQTTITSRSGLAL